MSTAMCSTFAADRHLLELAAIAAGLQLGWDAQGAYPMLTGISGNDQRWNPLADDGDALRLAVRLRINTFADGKLDKSQPSMNVTFPIAGGFEWTCALIEGGDACAALRRAIVRAAAAIGRVTVIAT